MTENEECPECNQIGKPYGTGEKSRRLYVCGIGGCRVNTYWVD